MKAMKAMKAMKTLKSSSSKAMKAVKKPLQKGTKAMKATPVKGSKPAPLRKGNLQKLGQITLKEKMKKIAETEEDEVGSAMILRDQMTASEKKTVHGKSMQHT